MSILLWILLATVTFGLILLFPILRGSGTKTRTYRTCQSCGYRQLLKQPGLFGMLVVTQLTAALLAGCTIHVGTDKPEVSQPQQQHKQEAQPRSSHETVDPHAAYVARQQARQKAEKERWEAEQAAREERKAERERQYECQSELQELRQEQAKQADATQEQEALKTCANSGIPPGTYQTRGGLPHVEVQVTESGCAAYEAFAFHEGTNTRRFVTEHGTREIEYEQGFDCTVGGVLDANRRPYHSRWQGNGCRRKILDVVAEGVAWTVNGTTIAATANVAGGKRPVTLRRIDSSTSGWEGGSPLWKKQRSESDDEVRVSVALTPIPPQPDADHDWCFDLQVEKSANR